MEGEGLFPDSRQYPVQTPTNSDLSTGDPHMSPTRAPRGPQGSPLTRTFPTALSTSRAWVLPSSESAPPQTSLCLSSVSCHPWLHQPQPRPLLPEPRHRLSVSVPRATHAARLWAQEGKTSPPRTQGRATSPRWLLFLPRTRRGSNCQNRQET